MAILVTIADTINEESSVFSECDDRIVTAINSDQTVDQRIRGRPTHGTKHVVKDPSPRPGRECLGRCIGETMEPRLADEVSIHRAEAALYIITLEIEGIIDIENDAVLNSGSQRHLTAPRRMRRHSAASSRLPTTGRMRHLHVPDAVGAASA